LAHGAAAAVATQGPVGIYRPRHPEHSGLYRLFAGHFDPFVAEYPERFEHDHGPLRPHVTRTVYEYLDCGRLHGGFARIRCPKCRGEHLLAFSCQTRSFCPSCQAKRSALFGEHLVLHVLEEVPHRHVVFTIPKALRGLFQRERRLLALLTNCAHACIRELLRKLTGQPRAQVGMVNVPQTFGSYAANFHPHVHALVTDGAFLPDGSFERVWHWDQHALTELFRRLVLACGYQ
jgi:ribosomal protein S27E